MTRRSPDGRADQLAVFLAQGKTVKSFAEEGGVALRTAYRLAADPAVRAKSEEIRRAMLDGAVGVLSAAATEAAGTLVALLHEEMPDRTRLGAAKEILRALIHVAEHADYGRRIAELEATITETHTTTRTVKARRS